MRILFEDTKFAPTDPMLRLHRIRFDGTGSSIGGDLWFRFCTDPDDAGRFAVYVYALRADAINTEQPYRSRIAYAGEGKFTSSGVGFSLPLTNDPGEDPDLTGMVLEISTIEMPLDWSGCVWGYVGPSGTSIAEDVTDALEDHAADGKALDGLAFSVSPDAMTGNRPNATIEVDEFEYVAGLTGADAVFGSRSQWQGRFRIAVRFTVPPWSHWWRILAGYVGAVRSLLADERRSAIPGVRCIEWAGGEDPRDGRATAYFWAWVIGQPEVLVG